STPRQKRRKARIRANACRLMASTSRKSRDRTCSSFSTHSMWQSGATTANRSSSSRTPSSAKASPKSKGHTRRTAKRAQNLSMPLLIGGSDGLYGSTMNYIKDGGGLTRDTPGGGNIRFGIREHGWCEVLNGISYHGLLRASGATFMVFCDCCRAAIRLAALAK